MRFARCFVVDLLHAEPSRSSPVRGKGAWGLLPGSLPPRPPWFSCNWGTSFLAAAEQPLERRVYLGDGVEKGEIMVNFGSRLVWQLQSLAAERDRVTGDSGIQNMPEILLKTSIRVGIRVPHKCEGVRRGASKPPL